MAQEELTTILTAAPLFFILKDFSLLPYFRMTQRTKYFKNAQKYLSNHTALRKRLAEVLEEQNIQPMFNGYYFPDNMRFQLVMVVNQATTNSHKCDLDNLVKSVLDAAQGLIFKNDRFCDSIYVQRYFNLGDSDFLELAFSLMMHDPIELIDRLAEIK